MVGGPITPGGWPRHQRVTATQTPGLWRVLSSWRLRDYDRHLWAAVDPQHKPAGATEDATADTTEDVAYDVVIVKLYPDDADAALYAATCGALGPDRLERHAVDLSYMDDTRTDENADEDTTQDGLW